MAKDLLGREMTKAEVELLSIQERLQGLLEHDLSPVTEASVKEAIATLWQAIHALALSDDRPDV